MWIAIAAVVIVVLLTLKGYSIDKKEKQEKNKNVTKTSKDPPIISEAALFNLIKLLKSPNKNFLTKMVAILAKPIINNFKTHVDPGKYNGASLLGLKGVVVKSHGNADPDSYFQAIKEAYLEAHAKITDKISAQLTRELEEHK